MHDSTYFEEHHLATREMVRAFAREEVAPVARHFDDTQDFPWENVKKMADLGLFGIPWSEELGGSGLDKISFMIAIEELARVCASHSITISAHTTLGTSPIVNFGTEEQKRRLVPRLASGKILGGFGLTEPDAGSDAGGTKTTAVRKGDHYVINGTKRFITHGGVGESFVITAVTNPGQGTKGISSFVLTKETCDLEQVKGLGIGHDPAIVPMKGFRSGKKEDKLRIGIAALSLGVAQGAFEEALKYTTERKQFGKRIAEFQGVHFQLSDMATELEAGRHLTYHAAWLAQNGHPYGKEAAMAKLFTSELAMRNTIKAIQLHGGYGYTKDYPVERFMRDAKIGEIGEGTSEVQRMVIARHLIQGLTL